MSDIRKLTTKIVEDAQKKQAHLIEEAEKEIAKKVGVKRMKSYLKKLDYNGMIFDTLTIDNFWLQGKSKFSQMQQIDFLERLYFSKLPISKRTENIMKDIIKNLLNQLFFFFIFF